MGVGVAVGPWPCEFWGKNKRAEILWVPYETEGTKDLGVEIDIIFY